jgi:hypothetical protein
VFGHRRALLEHRSRSTGRIIRTVVAVERWDPSRRRLVLVPGGAPAGWYRDVLASPRVRVTVAGERDVVASAVPVGGDGAAPAVALTLGRRRSRRRRPAAA